MAQKTAKIVADEAVLPGSKPKCGVVMPISSLGDYPESHWSDVYAIIRDAVSDAGLEASLVSYADESAFIHKTIVQNLYDNPIVICDVSGKNPNVMFELGLRLAFDKPTIVVKDNATTYSFDTGPIEHIPYPKDLRFAKIVEFKKKLADKVTATLRAGEDPNYSTFLRHFGKFTVAKLEEKEVSGQEYIIDALKGIQQQLATITSSSIRPPESYPKSESFIIDTKGLDSDSIKYARKAINSLPGVLHTAIHQYDGASRIVINVDLIAVQDTMRSVDKILTDLYTPRPESK